MKRSATLLGRVALLGATLAGAGCLWVVTAPIRMERAEKAEAAFDRLAALKPGQIAAFLDTRMADKLERTPDQQPRVAALNLEYARQLQATAASVETVRSKARTIRKQDDLHEAGLKEVLTADQFARFLGMKEEMRSALRESAGAAK